MALLLLIDSLIGMVSPGKHSIGQSPAHALDANLDLLQVLEGPIVTEERKIIQML